MISQPAAFTSVCCLPRPSGALGSPAMSTLLMLWTWVGQGNSTTKQDQDSRLTSAVEPISSVAWLTQTVVFLLGVHAGGLVMTLVCAQQALVHGATLALGLADCPGAWSGQSHSTGDAAVRAPRGLVGPHRALLTVVAHGPAIPTVAHNCTHTHTQYKDR